MVASRIAAIVGIGHTAYGKLLGRTELDLATEAIRAACADAGVAVTDIDGSVRYDVERVVELDLIHTVGVRDLAFFVSTPSGGGGLASTVGVAALAVTSGAADLVVVYRSRLRSKGSSYDAAPMAGGRPWEKQGTMLAGYQQFHHPFGLAAPAQEMALIARRHMHEVGTRAEAFGAQAVAQRAHAVTNPHALLRTPITLDDWRDARMIADPLRLLDCSLETDGAVAVLVAAGDRAADLRQPPAYVRAAVQGAAPGHYRIPDLFAWHAKHGSDWNTHMAERLWRSAELGPGDVDAAMVFDHFTPAVVMTLEDWGFCARGEGGLFVEDGGTRWPHGGLPVNTHGGSTSEASVHGFNHLPEAVRQLRGTAVNQVADCSVVFVNGAVTDPSGAVVLTR